jgi:hypothetical protein
VSFFHYSIEEGVAYEYAPPDPGPDIVYELVVVQAIGYREGKCRR